MKIGLTKKKEKTEAIWKDVSVVEKVLRLQIYICFMFPFIYVYVSSLMEKMGLFIPRLNVRLNGNL